MKEVKLDTTTEPRWSGDIDVEALLRENLALRGAGAALRSVIVKDPGHLASLKALHALSAWDKITKSRRDEP